MDNRTILGNANMAYMDMNDNIDVSQVIKDVFIKLMDAKDDIIKANKIDIKNNNGFKLDFDFIKDIDKKLMCIKNPYKKVEKDCDKFIINDSLGTICTIYNGNTYYLIELALKSILTRNSMIFVSNVDYMDFTNRLILILIKNVLEKYKIDKNLIQLLYINEFDSLLSNSVSINRVFVVGDRGFQHKVKIASDIDVITFGINHYDVYIENIDDVLLIGKLLKLDYCDIYVKTGFDLQFDDFIEVKDIDEAICQINFNTAGSSSIIFTDSDYSASYFVNNVKTNNIYVNMLPNDMDLEFDLNLFLKKKKIICHDGMMDKLFGGSYE